MKNHAYTDGKLLQTNKKYSQLKLRQKEKIHAWMYESYLDWYQKHSRFPDAKAEDEILAPVSERIEQSGIWVPSEQVHKHYRGIAGNLKKRVVREARDKEAERITLEELNIAFTVFTCFCAMVHTQKRPKERACIY